MAGGRKKKVMKIPKRDRIEEIGPYRIMEVLGKGGFGTVYKGLDSRSGKVVAIKRINLQGCSPEDLQAIEEEMHLLQQLSHPHIVHYIDSVREDSHLNIAMEYLEVGEVSSILKKFQGRPPERLIARYTVQVLKGLYYLHQQGVIHRDIKGANLLSDKDGVVKLADFGVATKLSESSTMDAVGTPYWMAPEVIEMKTQISSACDIWSVGCTVIEMLTGQPPLFDLNAMSALYHIVSLDHPPLPEGISPVFRNFLLQCFEKDPARRSTALGLLNHKWLQGAGGVGGGIDAPVVGGPVEAADEKLPGSPAPLSTHPSINHSTETRMKRFRDTPQENHFADMAAENKDLTIKLAKGNNGTGVTIVPVRATVQTEQAKDDSDASSVDWGSEGEMDMGVEDVTDVNALVDRIINTINVALNAIQEQTCRAQERLHTLTFSDIGAGFGARHQTRAMSLISNASDISSSIDQQGRPPDEASEDTFPEREASSSRRGDRKEQRRERTRSKFSPIQEETVAVDFLKPAASQIIIITQACGELKRILEQGGVATKRARTHLLKTGVMPLLDVLEVEDDDIFLACLQLVEQLLHVADPDNDVEVQLVQKLDSSFCMLGPVLNKHIDSTLADDIQIAIARICLHFCISQPLTFVAWGGVGLVVQLMEAPLLNSPLGRQIVAMAVSCMETMFTQVTNPRNDICRMFARCRVLPHLLGTIQLALEAVPKEEIRDNVYEDNDQAQRNFKVKVAHAGKASYYVVLCTDFEQHTITWLKFKTAKRKKRTASIDQCRVERSRTDPCQLRFVANISPKYDKVIVFDNALLREKFCHVIEQTEAPVSEADSSNTHTQSQTQTQTRSLSRSMVSYGRGRVGRREEGEMEEDSMSESYAETEDTLDDDEDWELVRRLVVLLQLFATADSNVKRFFALDSSIIPGLFTLLHSLDGRKPEVAQLLCACVRHLAMDTSTLSLMETRDLIPPHALQILVSLLGDKSHLRRLILAESLKSVYYLTQVSVDRQQQAAVAGVVPYLLKLIRSKDPLKEFAFPIMFRLSKASTQCREILAGSQGVEFLGDLLSSPYHRIQALDALAVWLVNDPQRVEGVLIAKVAQLTTLFREMNPDEVEADKVLSPLLKIMRHSVSVTTSLTESEVFISQIDARLRGQSSSNFLRARLLNLFGAILVQHPDPGPFIAQHHLLQLMGALAKDEDSVIVRSLGDNLFQRCSQLSQLSIDKQDMILEAAQGRRKAHLPLIAKVSSWEPNAQSNTCWVCSKAFGVLLRRHHCRNCGMLVCNPCSRNRRSLEQTVSRRGKTKQGKGRQRLCDRCCKFIDADRDIVKVKGDLYQTLKQGDTITATR